MLPTITVTPEQVVAALLVFVSQHSEYRWHREDLPLYQREIIERDEARIALTKFVNGEVPTYTYNDYLWGACTIYFIGEYALVVRVNSYKFHHNAELSSEIQRCMEFVFKGQSKPAVDSPKIGDREVRRLGRVQPVRVKTSMQFPDPGTWYAIGPDCIFFMKDRYDSPFLAGRFTVFMSPTGGKDVHGQPHLAIASVSERDLARYLDLAEHVNANVRASAARGMPDHGTFWLGR